MAAYFYDAAGHLVAEQNGGFIIEYQYDKSGRRTGRFTSFGNHVRYRYDPTGALSAIQINDNDPITIERDKLGRIISEQFSQYLKRSLDYGRDGLLTRQSIDGAGGTIERRYTYDPAGNLTAKHDSHKGARRFDHDPMGRITEALDPEHQLQRFGYDPAGDLLEDLPDTGQGMRSARYNQTEYRFDAAGNLAERQNGDELTKYTWDENNRLKTARKADDTRIDMTYDALGRRRIKAINGERTFYHYDGDVLLCEQFEDQAPREYVYYPGTFEPLALIDGDGSIYYYHNDPNGLPQELTKPNGDIVWSAGYDALGRVDKILVDEVTQPLRMQGQYWDDEIGLCYNRYRYYDPQICSFISQDPLGLAAGENVYAYAPNVWGWVDPLGLCKTQKAKKIVDDAASLTGLKLDKYVDEVRYEEGSSWFDLIGGKRVVNIGSNTFKKTDAGQLTDSLHEISHAQKWHHTLNYKHKGNLKVAYDEFFYQKPFGSHGYAFDEVIAEKLAIKRLSNAMKLSPQQKAASSKYINHWRGQM